MKPQVLIVEDESLVVLELKKVLQSCECEVVAHAPSADQAMAILSQMPIDLILMDVHLKEGNGIDLTHEIKADYPAIEVLFLTAYNDQATITKIIESGASHYVKKPFDRSELLANISIILNKIASKNLPQTYHFGEGYIYSSDQVLSHSGELIKLSRKEQEALELLLAHQGRVVTYDQIMYHIWEDSYVSDESIRSLIYRLRTKLKDSSVIETISAQGFRIQ
jgi:DNA-binding response OmpR family regulator